MNFSKTVLGIAFLAVVISVEATTLSLDIVRPKPASKSCTATTTLPGTDPQVNCTTTVTMTPKYKNGKVSEICVSLSVTCGDGNESETCPDPAEGGGNTECFEPGEHGAVSVDCAGKTFTFGPGTTTDKYGDPVQMNWGDAMKKCSNLSGLVSS